MSQKKINNNQLLISFVVILSLLWTFGGSGLFTMRAQAAPGIRYVAPGGACGGKSPCYASIQDAVSASEKKR
jgi:hypothetical protein